MTSLAGMRPICIFLGLCLLASLFQCIFNVVAFEGDELTKPLWESLTVAPPDVPKQLYVSRRSTGLTHMEYLEYHVFKHGESSWNRSAKPQAYIQDHTFDSVFGTKAGTMEPSYFGRDDMTELFSNSTEQFEAAMKSGMKTHDHFMDINSQFTMTAYEALIKTIKLNESISKCHNAERPDSYYHKPGTTIAFYWLKANASDPTKVNNVTFAQNVVSALQVAIQQVDPRAVYDASMHTPVSGYDSNMNVVIKLWLCDAKKSVASVRAAQKMIESDIDLEVDFESSFMIFAREVTLWDLNKGIHFNMERLSQIVDEEAKHCCFGV